MPRRTMDLAFTRHKLAIFVDGCFWHGCPEHFVSPKNNAQWWLRKIQLNRQRDAETTEHLTKLGWRVLRLWEHVAATDAVAQVERELTSVTGPKKDR